MALYALYVYPALSREGSSEYSFKRCFWQKLYEDNKVWIKPNLPPVADSYCT